MTLNYVTLTLDLYDGQGNPAISGTAAFTPSAVLTDAGAEVIGQQPVTAVFHAAGPPAVTLLATDNAGPQPAGWTWSVSFDGITGAPAPFSFFLPYTGGASQSLSTLIPVSSGTAFQAYTPLPEYAVPAPTGLTAADTPAVTAVIARLAAAGGNGTLLFGDGTYQVDSNALVIRSCSNFTVKSTGATVITQAPNRAGLAGNVTGNILTIADCTDFRVEGITLDGLRDTVAPLTPLTAAASSGQPSVTVAAGQGANYIAGQGLAVMGGYLSGDFNKRDGFANQGGNGGLIISSITPGGGSGGGDLITFTTNLANTYSTISSTPFSDGFGPFAYGGAYLTPYQTGFGASVAGRTLGGEDQQNALHLLNCQRFTITRVTARNIWESGIKCGSLVTASTLTDGCSQGIISGCTAYHGYDQGVSLWVSQDITVTGCIANAAGWAGIAMSGYSGFCTVTGNVVLNSIYEASGTSVTSGSGSGIAIEGGAYNQVRGNIISGTNGHAVTLTQSSLLFGHTWSTGGPTTSAFLEMGTAAGTSVQVSATATLVAGASYSLADGERTEVLTIASIVDGTHVTFTGPVRFSHASGTFFVYAVAEENVIEGNTIYAPVAGDAVHSFGAVRSRIAGNVIQNPAASAGSGVVCAAAANQSGPSTVRLGGDGSLIDGNIINGTLKGIICDSVSGVKIRGNDVFGMLGNQAGIIIDGLTDSEISGNYVHDIVGNAGIFVQVGQAVAITPARLVISGNTVRRTANEGVIVLTGDSLTITGNVAASCGGNAGINLRGVTSSVIADNICNSNKTSGIQLEDQSATACQYNRVTGNTTRGDGTGVNVTTGNTWTQQHGIVEKGTANNNLLMANETDSNAVDQLTTVGAGTVTHYNIISGTISA